MRNRSSTALHVCAIGGVMLALAGCNGSNRDNLPTPPEPPIQTYSYEVTLINLTHGQPLAPAAVMLHDAQSRFFDVGEPASDALEVLAESGDPTDIVALQNVLTAVQGDAPLPPGESETFVISIEGNDATHLSVLTMLANTNDGFSAVQGLGVSTLATGDSVSYLMPVYDAGTEENSENATTLVTQSAGEGFNPQRDDVNFVAMHPGIVGVEDGLDSSALSSVHRFDNPVARIMITRTE